MYQFKKTVRCLQHYGYSSESITAILETLNRELLKEAMREMLDTALIMERRKGSAGNPG